jgi:hypothetical protein
MPEQAPTSEAIEALAKFWQAAPDSWHTDRDGARRPRRDHRVGAAQVQQALAADFTPRALAGEIAQYLTRVCDVFERAATASAETIYRADCALAFVVEGQTEIPSELVGRILRSFPVPGWEWLVSRLVQRTMTLADLLDVEADALQPDANPEIVQNCIYGIVCYLSMVEQAGDPARARAAAERLNRGLTALMAGPPGDISTRAAGVRRHLETRGLFRGLP